MTMHFHQESSSLVGVKGVRINFQEKQEKWVGLIVDVTTEKMKSGTLGALHVTLRPTVCDRS